MQNCLRDRSQKFIVNSFYSTRILVKYEVHQVSVLVPTLFFFNLFLCDTFILVDSEDIASYADNTLYSIRKNKYGVETKLEIVSIKLLNILAKKA